MTVRLTPELLGRLRVSLRVALDEIGAKHGMTLRDGNCTYSADGAFTLKIEGVVAGGLTKEQSAYEQMREMIGLPPRGAKVRAKVKGRDAILTVDGFRSKKVLLKDESGLQYKVDPDWIKSRLVESVA
jgi:hypothetical protein